MPQKEKIIGRVIQVESQFVFIELNEDIKNLVKSSYYGIEYIGRINTYVVIRGAASKIIARVTKIELSEEYRKENKTHFLIDKKIIKAELFGEIKTSAKDSDKFDYGISNYPLIDSPVEFVTENNLDVIFDSNEKEIDNKKPSSKISIGNSAVFEKYQIKMDANSFFGKHAAILGNTGSGKSCTITAILQSIFSNEKVKNGHFIIFDTNGEYKKAFSISQNSEEKKIREMKNFEKEMIKRINPLYISADESEQTLKIPHWFLNKKEYKDIFRPSEGSQEPVLNRAIALGKLLDNKITKTIYQKSFVYYTFYLIKRLLQNTNEKPFDLPKKIRGVLSVVTTETLNKLKIEEQSLINTSKTFIDSNLTNQDGFFQNNKIEILIQKCDEILQKYENQNDKLPNANKPIFFDFKLLIDQYFPLAILMDDSEGNSKVREYCSTLLFRIKEKYDDSSYDFLLKNSDFDKALAIFLRFVTGMLSQKEEYIDNNLNIITQAFKNQSELKSSNNEPFDKTKINQVVIIDLHSLSAEIIENITAIIGRLILDFLQHFEKDDRGKFPICMILEEAHRYIPETKESPAKEIFERIAKEGRKFGLGLIVSSQRPSELSKTVLSQCNSFIVHKIQNPEDLNHVRRMTPYLSEDVFRQLPVIPRQYALMFGDCVRFPVLFKVRDAFPKPKSEDSNFVTHWENENVQYPNFELIAKKWEGEIKLGETETAEDNPVDAEKKPDDISSIGEDTQKDEEIKIEDIPF